MLGHPRGHCIQERSQDNSTGRRRFRIGHPWPEFPSRDKGLRADALQLIREAWSSGALILMEVLSSTSGAAVASR